MGKKRKFDSIRFKLFTMLCISTMSIVFIIVIINNIVLETFYTYSKTEKAKTISKEINQFYNNVVQYDINSELRQIEIQNNMDILIEDVNEDIVYSGNKEMIGIVTKTKKSKSALTIYTNDNTIIKKFEDNNKCLMLIRNLDNGSTLYIRIPITPIKESVKISNESLGLVAVLMILISGGISSYISRKFTDPIVQLNNITQKMSKLDFSERYEETGTNDEINTLGRNINTMSDKLEATIGQLRQNNNQLEKDIEEKSKIDEMRKQFISDVSHELKTPLTSMKVLSDSLLTQEDVPVELYKEFMGDLSEEIERENKIINDLLSLVKMDKTADTMNISSVNINTLVERILKQLRPIAAKNNIEVVFESFRPVTAEVDEVKLSLAITNLVENAIKYNQENGWVHVALNADHKLFYIEVADSGIGISPEETDHIFERFYRVDKSHSREIGGTGLGLAIARSGILMHHGIIKVYSEEGEGTTFTVRVPLVYQE